MLLRMGETIIEVNPESLEPVVSRRSGEKLERFCFEHMIRGEELNTTFLGVLDEAKKHGLESVNTEHNILKRYEITNNSYIYSGHSISQDTIFTHIIELQEEDLKIEALLIDDLEVVPYSYRETFQDKLLRIEAKARLTSEQAFAIKALIRDNKSIKVVRKGLSQEPPLTMKFETSRWSQHENFTKQELNLIEELGDVNDTEDSNAVIPDDLTALRELELANSSFLEELVNLLISKRVMTKDDLGLIKTKIADKSFYQQSEQSRVEDIDI